MYNVKNLDRAIRKLSAIPGKVEFLARRHLTIEGEKIMATSKETYVPVDTGNLRNTGHVSPPVKEGQTILVQLGFGNNTVEYALIVHEDLYAHHPVGQAKYLEIPFSRAQPGVKQRFRKFLIKEVFK